MASRSTISAGSTPTRLLSGNGRVNEIRAGTYVLGDRQQVVLGAMEAGETAAVVAATVVSSAGDRFVLDAGAKALTKDRPDWLPGFGEVEAYPDVVIEKLSDYHGVTRVPPLARRPGVGEVVAVVPNHICPVVDLVSSFTVSRRTVGWSAGRSTHGVGAGKPWRGVRIEPMVEGDWPEVRRIYAEGIATGDATFETEVPDWSHWDRLHRPRCRLVARDPKTRGGRRLGRVVARLVAAGLCRRRLGERLRRRHVARPWRRPRSAGSSDPGIRERRLLDPAGRRLVENEASLALHERVGFRRVGVQERIGRDFTGRWRDRVLLERRAPKRAPERDAMEPVPRRTGSLLNARSERRQPGTRPQDRCRRSARRRGPRGDRAPSRWQGSDSSSPRRSSCRSERASHRQAGPGRRRSRRPRRSDPGSARGRPGSQCG